MSRSRPRRLSPLRVPKVWGARDLAPWFENPPDEAIGEVHFAAPTERSLRIKFIFAADNLSVQVHPDGCIEMWYILRASSNARVVAGFAAPVSNEDIRAAIKSGAILDFLEGFRVCEGDSFLIPPRTVHAILSGIVVCEVKYGPDTVFRLYDDERKDPNRELHVDEALEIAEKGPLIPRARAEEGVLAACDQFTVMKLATDGRCHYVPTRNDKEFLVVVGGSGDLGGEQTKAGDVWYMDAGVEEFDINGRLTLLKVVSVSPGSRRHGL